VAPVQDATFVARPEDMRLVEALKAGDEEAFRGLVQRHHAALVRLARRYVSSEAVAEEVAQETWAAVLTGIDRFEGRSSLRTWIFRILVNRARTRGVRESRSVPFASLTDAGDETSVDPDRFDPQGSWRSPPEPFGPGAEQALLEGEALERIEAAIGELPPMQATVIRLRDVEGFGADEVSELLDLSAVNQRVLLHRARSKVRSALEDYFRGDA
jgi:RNA polymerase sigma-70 factor (ECF subfamily)